MVDSLRDQTEMSGRICKKPSSDRKAKMVRFQLGTTCYCHAFWISLHSLSLSVNNGGCFDLLNGYYIQLNKLRAVSLSGLKPKTTLSLVVALFLLFLLPRVQTTKESSGVSDCLQTVILIICRSNLEFFFVCSCTRQIDINDISFVINIASALLKKVFRL